jgi:hypothetical protein
MVAAPPHELLAPHSQADAAVDLVTGRGVAAKLDDGAGVRLRLQQARNELGFEAADDAGGLFQPQIVLEPAGHHVAEGVPPAGRVGLLGQGEQGGPFVIVIYAIRAEQVGHVAELETGPAALHPADLGN